MTKRKLQNIYCQKSLAHTKGGGRLTLSKCHLARDVEAAEGFIGDVIEEALGEVSSEGEPLKSGRRGE